ncbi:MULTISPECIES: hypothetical protein [unclassified Streptomyces]|uniref:hypothetical protein n=1 Tax=unclassified Streptomyces TaxID=2593676 RepID=UPI000DBA51D2|nr:MULTISPECIES: hypothetical protein [unclassified Streptomyces]MYU07580.1 hypothetical protein [Streptomyces sp. SID8366]MYU63335.1 hypothetical protein [Streptomyces sp. SID69]RAJ60289.1 hypothetical protein K376_02707 [Streptomyces sp. PsTaAH-130]
MLPSSSPPTARHVTGVDRLLTAAVRLSGTLPATRSTLGVVRGRHRSEHERTTALRARLSERGVPSVELNPVPEPGERGGVQHGLPPRSVGLLVHTPGVRPEQAMRAAALWRLPLLIDRPDGVAGAGACHQDVIGIHLAGRGYELALRQVDLASQNADPGPVRLILDNEKITVPDGRRLGVTTTGAGLLEVRGESFGVRRVRRLRFERAWGTHRLDVDGVPVREVRAPLRMEVDPGRLHLVRA